MTEEEEVAAEVAAGTPLVGEQKLGPSGTRPMENLEVTSEGRAYDGLEDDS